MDFDIAINQHLNWVNLVESLFNETDSNILNSSSLIKDNECDLGKWIYSADNKLLSNKIYQDLVQVHKDFHFQAGTIILNYQSGRKEEAEQLHKSFKELSMQIISLLNQLKAEINNNE